MTTVLNTAKFFWKASPIVTQCRFYNVALKPIATFNFNYTIPTYPEEKWGKLGLCPGKQTLQNKILLPRCIAIRYYTNPADQKKEPFKDDQIKLTLFQRFKQMYRDYWYVLVPVHLVTSAFWFGGFYYLAKSGIDIAGILESWNISEKIVNPLRDSSMGYIAVSYALYKIFTPLRYTVTLGGTTLSIKYLKEWGYIKPVPTTQELRDLYKEKRDNLIESMKETRDKYEEKKENIMQQMKDKREELKQKTDELLKAEQLKQKKQELMQKKEELMQKKDQFLQKKDEFLQKGEIENAFKQMKETKKDLENTLNSLKEKTENLGAKPQPIITKIKDAKDKSKT